MKIKSKLAALLAVCSVPLAAPVAQAQDPIKGPCSLGNFEAQHKSDTYAASCTKILQRDGLSKKDRSETLYQRSLWYGERGRPREAVADLRIVLSMFPEHAPAADWLGRVLGEGLGDYRKARKWILRSIELDPNRAEAYTSLGILEGLVGRFKEGADVLTRAINIKPSYAWARHTRARLLKRLKRWDDVLVETTYLTDKSNELTNLGKVTTHQREIDLRFDAALMHGKALRAKESFEAAEKWYNALVVDYPNAIAFVERSEFLYSLPYGTRSPNRAKDAFEDVEKAIRLDPDFSPAYQHKAFLLGRLFNQPKEALRLLDKAIKLRQVDHVSPYLKWEKALNLRRLGKPTEASALALNAIYQSSQVDSSFAYSTLKKFTKHGYYVAPKTPDGIDRAIEDAVIACMHDERCS